jgi:hypothetical protein
LLSWLDFIFFFIAVALFFKLQDNQYALLFPSRTQTTSISQARAPFSLHGQGNRESFQKEPRLVICHCHRFLQKGPVRRLL